MDQAQRTHNPLVLGSNPSGPTNQPIDDAVVRKTGANTRLGFIGRLKLFSQLFKTEIPASASSERRSMGVTLTRVERQFFKYPRAFWRVLPVGKPVRGVVESRAALADPGGEIGVFI